MRNIKGNKGGESGRTMIEILMVIGIMGILSLSIAYGYVIAQRRQAAGELTNLVTKSAAGVITSRELDRLAEAYRGQIGEEIEIGEALPLGMYISNVRAVEAGSREAALYGIESFQAPMGTVISAHAMKNGRGLVVKLNQFATEVCEDVLRSGMAYEGVWDFNGEPGIIYSRESLEESPETIKSICEGSGRNEAGLENVLDIGLIFENTGLTGTGTPEADCNEKCAVSILGGCGLTERPECQEASCDRKYYDIANCAWKCYDGQGSDCSCVNGVWSVADKACVACLNDADCFNRDEAKPVCADPGRESYCEACPPETLYDKVDQRCEDCVTLTGGARPVFKETDDGGTCVECQTSDDCPDHRPICDANNTCQACPKGSYILDDKCQPCPEGYTNTEENASDCPVCAAGYVGPQGDTGVCCPEDKPLWDVKNNRCVVCLSNSDCTDSKKPICQVTAGVCQACPADKPLWDGKNSRCVQCLVNKDCVDSDKPICQVTAGVCQACPADKPLWDSKNNRCVQCFADSDCAGNTPVCDVKSFVCKACGEIYGGGINKPYWDGQKCVECLTNNHCEEKGGNNPYCKKNVCSPLECAYIGKSDGLRINGVHGDACNRFSTSSTANKPSRIEFGGTFADRKTCNQTMEGVLYYHSDRQLKQVKLASSVGNARGKATLNGKNMLETNNYSFKQHGQYSFWAETGAGHWIPSGVVLDFVKAAPDLMCH